MDRIIHVVWGAILLTDGAEFTAIDMVKATRLPGVQVLMGLKALKDMGEIVTVGDPAESLTFRDALR